MPRKIHLSFKENLLNIKKYHLPKIQFELKIRWGTLWTSYLSYWKAENVGSQVVKLKSFECILWLSLEHTETNQLIVKFVKLTHLQQHKFMDLCIKILQYRQLHEILTLRERHNKHIVAGANFIYKNLATA